jgi:hypothetical protein
MKLTTLQRQRLRLSEDNTLIGVAGDRLAPINITSKETERQSRSMMSWYEYVDEVKSKGDPSELQNLECLARFLGQRKLKYGQLQKLI